MKVGTPISHYKILEKIGQGGMGEVYRASDTKLNREVALKFLTQNLGTEEDKKRFHREAQAAAALNHPNIATIFEIDESDGRIFIVMEYIEGRNLAEMVRAKGGSPLPLDDAITYSIQIAESLHAAHQQGVVHRDIKSANVMVTSEGRIKVMDFGLAKLASGTGLTKTGSTLGTAAYMSPEQAKGVKVDHRTDIWSLGVVIYEMITGQLPFKGEYDQSVTYAILNEDPEPLTALRTGVPMAMDGIISKALAKGRELRYQNVNEIPADLRAMETRPSGISTTSVPATVAVQNPPALRSRWPLVRWVASIIAASIVSVTLWESFRPSPSVETVESSVVRFELSTPSTHRLRLLPGRTIAISPDGKQLAYSVTHDQVGQLYLRTMDQLEGKLIPGTEGAGGPFFSPDGSWLGFVAKNQLLKVAVTGGLPITICEASAGWLGPSWGSNDMIVFPQSQKKTNSGLMKVSAAGGVSEVVTTPSEVAKGQNRLRWPSVLPDGETALCTIWNGKLEEARIGVVSLQSGEVKELTVKGTSPQYTGTGHIVYAQGGGSLFAAPFDLGRLDITGTPTPVIDGVSPGQSRFTLSHNGTLVYLPAASSNGKMVIVDRNGTEQRIIDDGRSFRDPSFSPDGTRVAVSIRDDTKSDIWIYDLGGGTRSRLTSEGGAFPVWTPDGKRVTFTSNRAEREPGVFWVPADGSGPPESLIVAGQVQFGTSWTPDGKTLFFQHLSQPAGWDIWTLSLTGDSTTRPFLATPFRERYASVSPDGKWVAYQSDESGRPEVYVRALDGTGGRYPVSRSGVSGFSSPHWAANGRELLYPTAEGMVSATIETDPVFKVVQRQVLFELTQYLSEFDIHPDGDRFVMIKKDETSAQMVVVVNWFEELKRKVPTGK